MPCFSLPLLCAACLPFDMETIWKIICWLGRTGRSCGGRFSLRIRVHFGSQTVLLLHGSRHSSSTHHLAQGWNRTLRPPIFPGSSFFSIIRFVLGPGSHYLLLFDFIWVSTTSKISKTKHK